MFERYRHLNRHPVDESSSLPAMSLLVSSPSRGEAVLHLDPGRTPNGNTGMYVVQHLSYTDCLWLRERLDKHIEATMKKQTEGVTNGAQ